MSRLLSTTRKVKVTDAYGETFTLTFKTPSQSRLRALQKVCLGRDGNLDAESFARKISEESLELLLDVEGAQMVFEDASETPILISASASREDIQKIEGFHRDNKLEYHDKTGGWKGAFVTLFPDVYDRAMTTLWTTQPRLEESAGK